MVLPTIRRQGFYGNPLNALHRERLETRLLKYLAALQTCTCAFSKRLILDRIKVVCMDINQSLPDVSLIGADPKQISLDGF